MDVFRFHEGMNKSVIAYPENCQVCGQCYVYCLGHSLALSGESYSYPVTSVRAASKLPMNGQLYISRSPDSKFVTPAIAALIGSMGAHNALIWMGKAKARRQAQGPTVVRMDTNQRLQHLVMLISFLTLVFSGFAIRYSGTWFVHNLGLGVRLVGIVHRLAGLALMTSGLYHLAYITATREGRRLFRDLWPRWKDLKDLVTALRHHLGAHVERPRFGRFTYAEKAEYWALFAGTASMGLTGTLLWAYKSAGSLLSFWWVDLARTVHFYEAIVASLTILVWHFYQVFLDPDAGPMNWAWWNGEISAEHYQRGHELDASQVEGRN
jgi:cytochrome b subunit of formate dehydrogenase